MYINQGINLFREFFLMIQKITEIIIKFKINICSIFKIKQLNIIIYK